MQEKHVLVVKLSSLGDLLHALPVVHELKTGLSARIDWAVQEEYRDLVSCFTDVDRVIAIPRRHVFRQPGRWLADLRKDRYSLIVDLQGLLKSAWVARLARGDTRIGPSFHREGSRLFYNAVGEPRDRNRHAVEQCLDTARYLGLSPGPAVFPVAFPDTVVLEDRPRVAILPVSRWPSKNWSADAYAEVVAILGRSVKPTFYLLGAKEDAAVCGRIEQAVGKSRVVNVAGLLSLVETGGLLKQMDLLISNDSGPVHMAAAVGTPTLVLFGPTDPARTGPYGEGHRLMTAPLSCRPCFSRECREQNTCLKAIAPAAVAQEAQNMLAAADLILPRKHEEESVQ